MMEKRSRQRQKPCTDLRGKWRKKILEFEEKDPNGRGVLVGAMASAEGLGKPTHPPVGLGETGKECPRSPSCSVLLMLSARGRPSSAGTGSQGTEHVKTEGSVCAGARRRASTPPLFENEGLA